MDNVETMHIDFYLDDFDDMAYFEYFCNNKKQLTTWIKEVILDKCMEEA